MDERVSLVFRQKERQRVVKLDDNERRAIELSLVERQARLFEAISDTTLTSEERRAGAAEILQVSVLLRRIGTFH
jgi:hypothetical protein